MKIRKKGDGLFLGQPNFQERKLITPIPYWKDDEWLIWLVVYKDSHEC